MRNFFKSDKEKKGGRLTSAQYWANKYHPGDFRRPFVVNVDINLASREVDKYLQKYLLHNPGRCIEIGCAPGSWMHYFSKTFGYHVDGLEYTKSGVELTRENLRLLGIDATVYEEDLFQNSLPKESYDVVFSSGFIEHFTKPFEAIQKHVELLRSGGLLVLKIPNLQGFNLILQKYLDYDVLLKHNLSIMNLDYFRELTKDCSLALVDVSYVGRINFCLSSTHRRWLLAPLLALQFICTLIYRMCGEKFPFGNGKNISPYIIGIYRKK